MSEPAFSIQQNVFWLQIPVNNVQRVEILQSRDDFGGVEARPGLRESLFLLQMEEELSSVHIVQHEIELVLKKRTRIKLQEQQEEEEERKEKGEREEEEKKKKEQEAEVTLTAVWKEYRSPTKNGCLALFINTFLSAQSKN